jgi:hypothetical protein
MTDPKLHRCEEPGCPEVGCFGEEVFGLWAEGIWWCQTHWRSRLKEIQKAKFAKAVIIPDAREEEPPEQPTLL